MNHMTMPPKDLWLPDEVGNFSSIANPVRYREGAVLFWEGDPSDRVFFIEEGFVEMYHYTETGTTVTLLLHQPGDLVGLGGVFSDTVRKVYAKTLSACLLWEISRGDFFQMLYDHPKVTLWVAASLSDRLRTTDQAVLRVASMQVEGRLALVLLDLAQRHTPGPDGRVVLEITHQELANMVGACRQTTTSVLGKLRRKGVLDTRKGILELLDLPLLERIAQAAREQR